MSGMLNRLKTILKGDAKSESPVLLDPIPIAIQKEQGFFSEANNLMDFEEDAPAIEASNLSAHERYVFPIEIEYNGFYLQGMDEDHIRTLMDKINKGETEGLWTIAEFTREYLPVLNEEVERYENDIEAMPEYYGKLPKPNYGKSTTAKFSLKSAKTFPEDTGTQIKDTQDVQLSEMNLAYINRPESDTRKFAEFRDDWEHNKKLEKDAKIMNLLKGEEDADIIP